MRQFVCFVFFSNLRQTNKQNIRLRIWDLCAGPRVNHCFVKASFKEINNFEVRFLLMLSFNYILGENVFF